MRFAISRRGCPLLPRGRAAMTPASAADMRAGRRPGSAPDGPRASAATRAGIRAGLGARPLQRLLRDRLRPHRWDDAGSGPLSDRPGPRVERRGRGGPATFHAPSAGRSLPTTSSRAESVRPVSPAGRTCASDGRARVQSRRRACRLSGHPRPKRPGRAARRRLRAARPRRSRSASRSTACAARAVGPGDRVLTTGRRTDRFARHAGVPRRRRPRGLASGSPGWSAASSPSGSARPVRWTSRVRISPAALARNRVVPDVVLECSSSPPAFAAALAPCGQVGASESWATTPTSP